MNRAWHHFDTHCSFMGGPGSGKSIRVRLGVREKIKYQCPVFSFDFHGGNFYDAMEYCAFIKSPRPSYFIDFSRPDRTGILPWNFVKCPPGAILTSHINRLAETLLKPWNSANANDMATYARMIKVPLAYSAVTGEPLHHSAHLLDFGAWDLRDHAIEVIPDFRIRETLTDIQRMTTSPGGYRQWENSVLSSQNRLDSIAGSEIVRLFTGRSSTFSIEKAWEEGANVHFNLTPNRKYLSPRDARTLPALLLDEILQCALDRAQDPREAYVYLDESQEYASPDMAPLLEGARKSGLRLTFIYHHEGQFEDRPRLLKALETAAQCKVFFAGLPARERMKMVDEVFGYEMAARMRKEYRYVIWNEYELEKYLTETSTWGGSNGWSSGRSERGDTTEKHETDSYNDNFGGSITESTRYAPRPELRAVGQEDYRPDEKRLILAQRFDLQRACSIDKLPDKTRFYRAPYCERLLPSPDDFVRFMESALRNNIPLHAGQTESYQKEEEFLARVQRVQRPERAEDAAGRKPRTIARTQKRETRPPRLCDAE